jgi:anthranilate phosphoribosyltransferase
MAVVKNKGPARGDQGAEAGVPTGYLSRLRLIAALDALLVEGSVTKAAARLDIGSPAMSRLLAQIREIYGDPILVRTGRGMSPTPFAEKLRLRVRAVAAEAERLLDPRLDLAAIQSPATPMPPSTISSAPAPRLNLSAPLAMRPALLLEGQPDPDNLALKLAAMANDPAPYRRLARYIALVGGGVGGRRPLDRAEAEAAFAIVLAGEADPVQIGALLVAMQARSITVDELAGFVAASRKHCGALPIGSGLADLDLPAYISPKSTAAPWFLHAARLVADAGHRVLIHGQSGRSDRMNMAVRMAGLPMYLSIDEARSSLERDRIGYIHLSALSPQLNSLMGLYDLIEMRSPLNLQVSLINPLGASASLLGGSTFTARGLHRDAAALLGWKGFTTVTTHRDVGQSTPFRASTLLLLRRGVPEELRIMPVDEPRPEAPVGYSGLEYWQAVWEGQARDERARQIIVSTAAMCLVTIDEDLQYPDALEQADGLWQRRNAIPRLGARIQNGNIKRNASRSG